MKNCNNSNEFALYKSGIHVWDLVFAEDNIMRREKDVYSGEWSEYEALTDKDTAMGSIAGDIPIYEINSILGELGSVNWSGSNSITLKNGKRYERYKSFQGKAEGLNKEAFVWAECDGDPPLDLMIENGRVIGFICMAGDRSSILVKHGCEQLSPLNYWNEELISKPIYTVKHLGNFMVPMKDGVKLSTDIWLPSEIYGKKKVPAIFIRTPYGRMLFMKASIKYVQMGYALVIQDVRGRGDSEGMFQPFINEMEDGDAAITWISEQPWSDGGVGTIGGSYGGFVQWAAAASGNPNLKAMVSFVTAGTPFVDCIRKGGCYMSGILAWIALTSGKTANINAANRSDWDEIINIRPIKDIPEKVFGAKVGYWDEWIEHESNDEYWKKADWESKGEKINVPTLSVSGWFDDDSAGSTQGWNVVKKYKRENQKLILGPWRHQFNTARNLKGMPLGIDAIRYDMDLLVVKWFDRYLKGIKNGIEKEPAVDYYILGDNKWIKSETWPPQDVQSVNLYFGSSGNAGQDIDDGRLNPEHGRSQKQYDEYAYDPKDPAVHMADLSENEFSLPANYREVEKRSDVLTYSSAPMKKDLTVAGDMCAVIYASSSAKDTDWVVRVTDVDEEGNSMRISDGLIKAKYRDSFEKPELLCPDKVYEYRIGLLKTAYTFKKGHRIRVQVTSSAKYLTFPNHNTGSEAGKDTEYIVANQKIYHSGEYRSRIEIPVLNENFIDSFSL